MTFILPSPHLDDWLSPPFACIIPWPARILVEMIMEPPEPDPEQISIKISELGVCD